VNTTLLAKLCRWAGRALLCIVASALVIAGLAFILLMIVVDFKEREYLQAVMVLVVSVTSGYLMWRFVKRELRREEPNGSANAG